MLIKPSQNSFYSARRLFLPEVAQYLAAQRNCITEVNANLINNFLTEIYVNNLFLNLRECFFLGNNFNLTTNYLGFLRNSTATITGTIPKSDRFATFTGSQRISTNFLPPIGSNDRCIYALINDSSTTGGLQGFWSYGTEAVGTAMYLWWDNSVSRMLFDYSNGTNLGHYDKKNSWYLSGFQHSSGISTGWINGEQILSKSVTINTGATNNLTIGSWFGTGRFVNGLISSLFIFNRALTSTEHLIFTNIVKKTIGIDLI